MATDEQTSPLSVRAWARRAASLQRELAAVADVDPRWWLLAGGVALAEPWAPPEVYLACDCEPDADTLMAYRAPRPGDPIGDAIARARAARIALADLHGMLPDQPLAVTVERATSARPTRMLASELDVAAFAIGDRCVIARLDDDRLPGLLAETLAGAPPPGWQGPPPFVCVSIGDEPLEVARHGHRRAWSDRGGPWLGLGRAGELAIVSTCHLVVDGYGHARITARIAELVAPSPGLPPALPPLAPIAGAVPLAVAWRELPAPTPRVLPLAYALGTLLHRHAGDPAAKFSPTFQIPVARGAKDDPIRLRRRVVAATTSLRFEGGQPEPFEAFSARTREILRREATATGLVSRLLAAARATPVPLSWKRRSISAKRPRWMESLAALIGGRALLSRIELDVPIPPTCAISSPSRMASALDPIGSCLVTIVDDGQRAAIAICGSGLAGTTAEAEALLDELLAR